MMWEIVFMAALYGAGFLTGRWTRLGKEYKEIQALQERTEEAQNKAIKALIEVAQR